MEVASSARSRPTALSLSVASAPNEASGVAHTRRPSGGNVPGSPPSTISNRSRSRSLSNLAAVMGGGKAGGCWICGGARWHATCSAALVLLTIIGFMSWNSFHASHWTRWWRRMIFRWTTCLCEIEPFNKEDWTQGQAMHLDRPDTFLRDFLKDLDVVVLNTGHHWNRGKMKEYALEFFLNGSKAPPVKRRPMVMALALKTAIRSVSVWIDEQLKGSGGEGGLLVKLGERKREGEGKGEGEGELGGEDGGGDGVRRQLGSGVELPAFVAGGGVKLETAIFATPDTKPMVFLRSITPRHFMEGEWDSGGRCDHLKHPFGEVEVANMTLRDPEKEDGVLGTSVHLLNITHLSAYRGDAHPAIWDPRSDTPKGQDCLHWCLPGVPDTWNELVYTHIVERGRLEKQSVM
ncbi:unnamed protein product [Closterium sp. Yama58-4]|nr:unnamed protein product [Closterium sp. Yama58-4]